MSRPDGSLIFRRVQRSTGFTDKSKAQQAAISYERASILAAEKRWSETSARRFLAEINAITGISSGDMEPCAPFLRSWLAVKRPTLAEATHYSYSAVIEEFITYLGSDGNVALSEISNRTMSAYREHLAKLGRSPRSINKAFSCLGMPFEDAVTAKIYNTSPTKGLYMRNPGKNRTKRRAFTFDQFKAIVRACDGEWRTMILICGYTGARRTEAARITWGQVKTSDALLTLKRSKTHDTHWLPIHPSLLAQLQSLKAGAPDSFVMPTLAKRVPKVLSKYFREQILRKIGIVQEYGKGGTAGRQVAEYSLHSLRHSLSTWLNAAGVSEMMRMRIVGHEDTEVSRGYTHTALEQAAAELAKVPAV